MDHDITLSERRTKYIDLVLDQLRRDIEDEEKSILARVARDFGTGDSDFEKEWSGQELAEKAVFVNGNHVFCHTEIDEEDKNYEWLSQYLQGGPRYRTWTGERKPRGGLKFPTGFRLFDLLGGYVEAREVFPTAWVKMLLEGAFNAGRSDMRGELRRTGEKP